MNIGIVTTWFERGAAYVSRQYKDLLEKEYSVYIFARGGEKQAKNDPDWDGPDVFWAKRFYRESTEIDLKEFKEWVDRNKIDIVLFNEQRWYDVLVFCRYNKIICGSYIDYYTEETVPLHGLYDFLICNTRRHASAFDWHPQVLYIPWGTDINLFKPSADSSDEDYTVFFHSAGVAPHRKGTEQVLFGFANMNNKEARLIIHTQIDLGKLIPEAKVIIEELKNENRLEIINKTVSAPGLYFKGDVYVYPSHLEGIGLTMAEALSSGLPLITVDFPPMNEFVDPSISRAVSVSKIYSRQDGYYWPKNDVNIDALSEAMDSYCIGRKELDKLKKKARIYAEKQLDWEKNADKLLKQLSSIKICEDKVKDGAEKHLHNYKKKYNRNLKTLIRDYFPTIYSLVRNLLKRRK
jgi:glycosyltransferase involved in cell wall biosynthesis